jgi:hypothetical protein
MTLDDLRAEGWEIELVEPQPDHRFRRMSRRDPRLDELVIVATRGRTTLEARAALLEHATLRLIRQVRALPRAAA